MSGDAFDRYSPYLIDDEPETLSEQLSEGFSGRKPTSIGEIDKLWIRMCDVVEDDMVNCGRMLPKHTEAYETARGIIAKYERQLATKKPAALTAGNGVD